MRIEDNLAAIAATIDALRTIERHDSQMFESAFTGFAALPPPGEAVPIARSWRDILGYYGDDLEKAREIYFVLRKEVHPDHGGNVDDFDSVQKAWEKAVFELSK